MKSLLQHINESLRTAARDYNYVNQDFNNPVNIIVGRFQPFTMGHMKCIDYAMEQKGVPTVICCIDTVKADEKHPFLTNDLWPIYERLIKDTQNIVDIIRIKSADIVKIKEMCEDLGYNVVSWTCGTDRYNDYNRMVSKYAPEIELLEIPRDEKAISATAVRNAIRQDNYQEFKQSTPKCLHSYFKYFREALEKLE